MTDMTAADFETRLNAPFTLENTNPKTPLTLIEVAPLSTSKRPGGGFSLLFESTQPQILPQGLYTVVAEDFHRDLFLVAVGQGDAGVLYEVIVN